jgi:hypothetical protein
MSNEVFNAATAKKNVEESTGMLDALIKQIKVESENNRSVCNWGFYGCTDETIAKIKKEVEALGFVMTVQKDEDGNETKSYEITW